MSRGACDKALLVPKIAFDNKEDILENIVVISMQIQDWISSLIAEDKHDL